MQALAIIGDEHQSLAAILHAMRFMLKEIVAGKLVADPALLSAMVHYLDAYAEQRHHPKEDLLFARLRERNPAAAAALDTLAQQHAAAPARIALLQSALQAYQDNPARLGEFADAFEHYADFYRGHMMLEEEQVLPRLKDSLSAADWVDLDAAFLAESAQLNAPTEDFSALFSQLVACAPAPIGLGAGPFVPGARA